MATDPQIQQLVEELNGSRRLGNKGRAAVRLDDLSGLLQIAETLKSAKAAGATPTKAEFDLLVDDVAMIHKRLLAVYAALRTRLGR